MFVKKNIYGLMKYTFGGLDSMMGAGVHAAWNGITTSTIPSVGSIGIVCLIVISFH